MVDRLDAKGGVQTYLETLLPALEARGVASTILTGGGDVGTYAGSRVRPVCGTQDDGPRLGAAVRDRLAEALRDESPDVCYIHVAPSPDVYRVAAEAAPVVAYAHDYFMACPGGARYLHRSRAFCTEGPGLRCFRRAYTERTTNRRPDRLLRAYSRARAWPHGWEAVARVLVASPFVGEVLVAGGLPRDLLRVVPYPVAPAAREPSSPATDVAFVGRLVASKGIDVLLRALSRLEGVSAAVAGDGPDRPRLERLASELGLGRRVRLLGWLDAARVAHLLSESRLLVLPSLWDEPFGIAGLEALAAGVPVVASDVGGVSSWLRDGEAGVLVPRADEEALAVAIRRLLEDETLRLELAGRGPAVAGSFSLDRHLELLLPELEAIAS